MSKSKQKSGTGSFLLGTIVFLVAVGMTLYASGSFFLAKAIEMAVGAPVKIQRFKLDLFNSEFGIYGLQVKNLKGFKEPMLASVPEISVHADLPALFENRIHIWQIQLNVDEITVERNDSGAVNLTEIGAVKNAQKQPSARSEASAPQPAERHAAPAKPPAVLIDAVVLSLGRARYVDSAGERKFALEIRNAVLKNVTDPAQITQQIVLKTLERVGLNALTQQLQSYGMNWDAQYGSAADQLKQAWGDLRGKFKF